MTGDPSVIAKQLTFARKAKGLSVDQIHRCLVEQRMTARSPKKTPLWIGTVRKWFHYELDEIQSEFRDDFAVICRILDIPSIDALWHDTEP